MDNNLSAKTVYLDHNATTPLDPAVVQQMQQAFATFGNPSSLHAYGSAAHALVERARQQVAQMLMVQPQAVVFTGSGTEAINLALKSSIADWELHHYPAHIITSQVEHAAALATCRYLERCGHHVTYLPVDSDGRIDPDYLRRALRPTSQLISIMYANNETGVLQPIEEISRIAREAEVPLHTDAVQSAGKYPLDLGILPINLLSLAAHKLYGPKGIGALIVSREMLTEPLIHGGGQEFGLRSGTENVLGIVGFGTACVIAQSNLQHDPEQQQQRQLRDRLLAGLCQLGNVHVNGNLRYMLPNTLNVSIGGIKGEALALALSLHGIAVSTGSACHAGRPSSVLAAMGIPDEIAHSAVRFSLGRTTSAADIDYTLAALTYEVRRLRALRPVAQVAWYFS